MQTQGELRTEQGQNKDILRTKKRLKRTYEDKPRTDLGLAQDKKRLAKCSHRGKVQFYQYFYLHELKQFRLNMVVKREFLNEYVEHLCVMEFDENLGIEALLPITKSSFIISITTL